VSDNDKEALSSSDVIITCSRLPGKGYRVHRRPGDAPGNCTDAGCWEAAVML